MTDDLELRCKKAVLKMANDVADINAKMCHFLEKYRSDYHKPDYDSSYSV